MYSNCKPIPISDWGFIQKHPYKIILAETPCQKNQGLQHTKELPTDSLLLFFGISPGTYFHTRNCYFPIDIVSLDKYARVLNIWTVKPNLQRIGPTPAGISKVLEANAGWCSKNGVRVGDRVPIY